MIEAIKKYNYWGDSAPETGYIRDGYIKKCAEYIGTPLIKVITGQRRCGKSYLMRMMINHLMTTEKVDKHNILYLNFELFDFRTIRTPESLIEIIALYRKNMHPKGKVYFFFDEIQEVFSWEKAVVALSQDTVLPCEVFITGSNAHLLSRELGTYLTGRYIPLEVLPYSYREYCGVTGQNCGPESFARYIQHGGMPETFFLATDESKRNYLSTLRDSILLTDIVERHKIRDVALLKRLFMFLADSIGSYFSANSVVRHLLAAGYKTNVETILNFIGHLTDAYLVHECSRFDIQGKRILSGERKCYLNDTSFRYFMSSSFNPGIGRYLENAIYLHLRRQGFTIYTGKSGVSEVDFVAEKGEERMYCQVAYLLADDSVVSREFGSLRPIADHFPKYVITMDQLSMGNNEGISHVKAWDFMK